MNELVREGYNKAAKTYAEQRDLFKSRPHLELLAERLDPGSTVLDAGCGSGIPIDSFLVERGYRVQGIDISEEQIALATVNVPGAGYKVRDMSELREHELSVDAIVSFYAIFHVPRETHPALFRTFSTFLRPGGLLLVTMGSSDWEGSDDDFHGVRMYWSHYDAETNRDLVRRAGFTILHDEIDTSGGEKHLVILATKS